MNDYKELVKRLREGDFSTFTLDEITDAIESLLADIEHRKTVAEGLVYLNDQLAQANAEKAEKIRQLYAEIRQLNSENFWLCRG